MDLLPKFKKYLFSQSSPSSKATVKNYLSDISRFIRWLALRSPTGEVEFDPSLVTTQTIEQFRKSSNLTINSLERNLSSLRKFFNFLVLEGIISESPFKQSNNKTIEQSDPYRLKAFKDYLYVYNASKLTIKNYLMDLKSFFKWLEKVTDSKNAWDLKETVLLSRIDNQIIEEYKRRLPYAPRSINRKLSSLRKYLKWAEDEGLISKGVTVGQGVWQRGVFRPVVFEEKEARKTSTDGRIVRPTGPRAYSKFPPLRVAQKTFRAIIFIPELILINPIISLVRAFEHLTWKLKGKPVFDKVKSQKSKVKSLPKEVFAPFAIATTSLPLHRKLFFHLAHTRPKWYKKYHQYSFSHYLHLAILVVVMSAVGFGVYQNFNPVKNQDVLGFANPQVPPRILSFQGRLTDSSDNPITSSTNLRFALYDSPTGTGSALIWQEVNTVTPDADGVFNVLLGNRSTMQQNLFAERAGLWLGVTVGQTAELTPRQRLATVAYAENADNLQGLPPITQSGAGTSNVVLALDSSGNLTIGGSATPTFQASGGQFTLSGNPLLLTTTSGSNANVKINPNGRSFIDLQKPLQNSTNNNNISSALGAVEFDDLVAILATSSGQSALTINQNSTGPLISASSSGTAKFTVTNGGAGVFTDDLAVNGGDIISTSTTFNLLNSTVTTLNIGGAATTINLGATSGTTTTANSLSILGNTTLGDTAADTIAFTGSINSNVVPDANNTRNLGSSSLRWNTVYGTNGDFTNIAGTVTGGSTSSSSWTINSDNATANAEIGSLAFETGTAAFNAALQWNASGDAGRVTGFDNTNLFNFPVGIYSQVSGANQTFTSGTLFKYAQPAVHAITQSGAFIGTDYDFSSNITVPDSSSGNQTGFKTTLKDGGASATSIGFQTAGTLDYGIDLGGTIGTAEIRLSNGETIKNTTDGTIALTATTTSLSGALSLAGTITGATGISSSGTITFSGLTASRLVTTDASSNLTNTISSANTAASVSDETGSGLLVFGTSPTISTSLVTDSTTFALVNTTATTVNFAGAATTLSLGASTGTTTVNNALTVTGNFSQSGSSTFSTGTGAISLNGDVTIAAGKNLTFSSGTGVYSQTFTGTTTDAFTITANSLTSGNALDISSTSTAAINGDALVNLSVSGANATSSVTRYGLYSSVTSTGTTSTNVGVYGTASGATNNYAAIFEAGNVGIGTTAPIGTLNIQSADSGVTSASANSDELVIEGSGNAGISILTPNTASAQISFGDPQDNNVGNINYNHSTNQFSIRVAGSNTLGFDIESSGDFGINNTAPTSQFQVNTSATDKIGQIIKAQASQTANLLEIRSSLDAILAKIDADGDLTARTLESTVTTGTAPLVVASTTQVANLYVASSDQPQPNLVLNSDFSRRNKWMTFMPEVFTDRSGWTIVAGTDGGTSANVWTGNGTGASNFRAYAGLSTWKDVRMSALIKAVEGSSGNRYAVMKSPTTTGDDEGANAIEARIINDAGTKKFQLVKRVLSSETVLQSVNYSWTTGNLFWLELEGQGSTYIAKVYDCGASACAKSTLSPAQTLSDSTASDSGYASGYIQIYGQSATAFKFGGLSTGDGGVYVEGWGPESWTVELNGTKGGQAIGFDEAADSGPIEKQWAMRAYIPATSRNIEVYQDTPDGSVLKSTSYISSMYLNTSGKGGSGSLVRLQFQRMNSALTQQGSTTTDDAGETSWTRVNSGAITTESGTRRARIRAHINASGTATGTGLFLLPQLEQGGVATPWRNAPADDDPIVWQVAPNNSTNYTLTSTTGIELDPRNLAVDFFLPWDSTIQAQMFFASANMSAGSTTFYAAVKLDGDNPHYSLKRNVTTTIESHEADRTEFLSAGKHRATIFTVVDTGTLNIGGSVTPPGRYLRLIATRGKSAPSSGANDLAEEYSVIDPTIEAGDVVRISSDLGSLGSASVEKVDKGYDQSILGIISTYPAITFGNYDPLTGKIIDASEYRHKFETDYRPVALSGRVPVKVTNENGDIHRGDTLTSSATKPGYAMKATKAGKSIGIAMEDFSPATSNQQLGNSSQLDANGYLLDAIQAGKVMTFVNLSWYDPDVYLTDSGQFVINKVSEQPTATLVADDVSGSMYQVSSGEPIPSPIPNTKYIIQNISGETLSRIGAYKDLFVANLKVGSLDVSEIKNFGKLCVQSESSEDFGLVKNVCSQTSIEKFVEQGTYAVKTAAGEVVTGGQIIAEAVVGTVRAGLVETQELIADTVLVNNKIISPVAEIATVKTDTITPLSSGKIVIKLEDHSATPSATSVPKLEVQNASGSAVASIDDKGVIRGQSLEANSASISGTLSSSSLTSDNASISGTLRTKNLIAENIESQVAGIKSLISGLSSKEASTSALPIDIASYSAQLSNVDTLQAQVGTFMQGLFAVGPTSLSDATVFGQLSVGGNLILADNSINVLGSNLEIQPLGQGGVSFLAGKVVIDSSGNLSVEGDATIKGTLFANILSPVPGNDLTVKLLNKNASDSAKFVVKNASGSAVASIDSEGNALFNKLNLNIVSPALALSETELIATGSAGIATVSAHLKEVTILNKLVTDKSLIYITPVGTSSATPFLLRQEPSKSFTVGVQNENIDPATFNWLIIN